MTQEQKALILGFITEYQKSNTLVDEAEVECEKLWELIGKAGEIIDTHEEAGDLHLQLELQFMKTIEMVKWKYFEYGSLGGVATQETDLKWNPILRKKVNDM